MKSNLTTSHKKLSSSFHLFQEKVMLANRESSISKPMGDTFAMECDDGASLSGSFPGDEESDAASSTKERVEKEMQSSIAKKEERLVFVVRVLVMVAIIFSTVAVSVAVYFFAKASDNALFEVEYTGYVNDIESLVVWEVRYNMALVQQLSGTTTSTALITQQTFPNVTQQHFEITGGFVDGMGGIMMAATVPLVPQSKRSAWEEYSVEHQDWLKESAILKIEYANHQDPLHGTIQDHEHDRKLQLSGDDNAIPPTIWEWNGDEKLVSSSHEEDRVFAPLWQTSPANAATVNVNLFSDPNITQLYTAMMKVQETVMSPGLEIGNLFDWMFDPEEKIRKVEPHAFIMEPMLANFSGVQEPIGFLIALTSYRNLFTRLLPEGINGIYCVVTDTCGNNMTFVLNGPEAIFLGYVDAHEGYEVYHEEIRMEIYKGNAEELCVHTLHIYPSATFEMSFQSNKPVIYTSIVALAFALTTFLLVVYDRLVTRRQERTKNAALRVVNSLFPISVQEKVLKGAYDIGQPDESNLIASFFPETTVMFADISGFTAWASTREPTQVFQLLETIYGAFDEIARRKQIFKVETVGDCYVAVAGLPDPRPDHAVAMVRFARDCQLKMTSLSNELEVALGPDTAELAFRIGIHSGAVTGGVLRGQNSRFQLFGDTMNMAARMESTGVKHRIHISSDTAELLQAAGKENWIEKRKEMIEVKGKGFQNTFWVKLRAESASHGSASVTDGEEGTAGIAEQSIPNAFGRSSHTKDSTEDMKLARLVDWNVAVLAQRLRAIQQQYGGPDVIDPSVMAQLKSHVEGIAHMYRRNAFHNFEHASHVTMSCMKMLSRVTPFQRSPPKLKEEQERDMSSVSVLESEYKDYTNDITDCPLTQFAVVYAALIHDCDHAGVSNDQLIREGTRIAEIYRNKSVAENHSFNLALDYLMQPEFEGIVSCMCGPENPQAEFERFSGILQNAVLATDVFDKEIKSQRDARWENVFGELNSEEDQDVLNYLRAQIVLEHMIQASDVIHTMQHWHVYQKWNEKLFVEMYQAFTAGRLEKNPSEFWYQGEIGFFDYYVIPLAKKIGDCGIFGVSSDEFLKYAKANRKEWELKGKDIVAKLVEKHCSNDVVEKVVKKERQKRRGSAHGK